MQDRPTPLSPVVSPVNSLPLTRDSLQRMGLEDLPWVLERDKTPSVAPLLGKLVGRADASSSLPPFS